MSYTLQHSLMSAALTCSLGLISASALAVSQGNILIRAGVAHVAPTGSSDEVTGIAAGAKIEADSGTSLGLTLTYMATDNLGIGVLVAWPFSHDIKAKGSIAALGKVAETDQLPRLSPCNGTSSHRPAIFAPMSVPA